MDNHHVQQPSGTEPPEGDSAQSSAPIPVQTVTKKRTVVRQRLAIALMAVGGTLAAAALLYFAYGQNSQ